jgi:hypothetical protein
MYVGSTVDAMSDAIEGADVMLYGVSLQYKESANVRRSSDASCSTIHSQSTLFLTYVCVYALGAVPNGYVG